MTTEQLFADRYRLERRLGVGGMATVQLAFDTRLERYVAVKLLAEHLAEDASFVSRFKREALAAARLVHPNIVQVFDFGSDRHSSRQFIVMEFVDGHSCAEAAARQRADAAARRRRDPPPGLPRARLRAPQRRRPPRRQARQPAVNTDGVVKLADFGIAKAAEQSDITKVGSVLGTAAYLSPEQARGEPAGPASGPVRARRRLLPADGRQAALRGGLADRPRAPAGGAARRRACPTTSRDVPPRWPPSSPARSRAIRQRRYADAAEMEDALRDGLAGVPAPRTSTRPARCRTTRRRGCSPPPRPADAPRRQPLQPVDEPPRRAPRAARRAPPPRAPAGRRAASGSRSCSCSR